MLDFIWNLPSLQTRAPSSNNTSNACTCNHIIFYFHKKLINLHITYNCTHAWILTCRQEAIVLTQFCPSLYSKLTVIAADSEQRKIAKIEVVAARSE